MKSRFAVNFALITLFSLSSLAIVPKKSEVYKDKTVSDRGCILQFSPDGESKEYLSGVLISPTRIVTVGHTDHFNGELKITCGASGVRALKPVMRLRHPRYDFTTMHPKSVKEWAKYDIAIVDVNPKLTASVQPLQLITDITEIRSLIAAGRCVHGGSGSFSSKGMKTIFLKTYPSTNALSETHATFLHPGDPEVVHGDSGGPFFCKRADNVFRLAGLIGYSGTFKSAVTGKTENVVAILVLRPELVNDFILR